MSVIDESNKYGKMSSHLKHFLYVQAWKYFTEAFISSQSLLIGTGEEAPARLE